VAVDASTVTTNRTEHTHTLIRLGDEHIIAFSQGVQTEALESVERPSWLAVPSFHPRQMGRDIDFGFVMQQEAHQFEFYTNPVAAAG